MVTRYQKNLKRRNWVISMALRTPVKLDRDNHKPCLKCGKLISVKSSKDYCYPCYRKVRKQELND